MINRTVISGFGGQGVVLTGQLMGLSAFKQDLKSTVLPTYGIEQRGGTANTTVIISDKEIFSPVADNPDTVCALNQPSVDRYEKTIREGGCLIANSSQVTKAFTRDDINVVEVPADDIALELGSLKVTNIVMMGAFIGYTGTISLDTAKNVIEDKFKAKSHVIDMNRKALDRGYEIGRKKAEQQMSCNS